MKIIDILIYTSLLLVVGYILMLLTLKVARKIRFWRQRIRYERNTQFITDYHFPACLREKVKQTYPFLAQAELSQVMMGLRHYFQLCALSRSRLVAMPSQVVDIAWHEFILFTREYDEFCSKAFGRFLHHTPSEAMRAPQDAQKSIERTWRLACHWEEIDPKAPSRLPLLFAMDERLKIPDGFHYSLNCNQSEAIDTYCASHIASGCTAIACSGGCSAVTDSTSSGTDWFDSASCGGGCSGD